ncbi:hypothetical protein JR316_0005758 [Psilocybe cubensis]|uniref:Uncharacterized protein n=2 Tax=Psilocybe cubensis TaxID=181762 RepID=A0ACB8H035_PSICU|nr:hypothetical protein JR316_0005758 [Psilocybe cubensis]KAH9481236.1 hypothetical protein JR316_0005758 [Psilocybe cubensis]
MSESKRKFQGDDNKRKKKYRSDGTPIWGKRHVEGPGVWVSCVKGKEKQTIGEIYELFESIASELWPLEQDSESENDTGLSLEDQIANEVSAIKRPRGQQLFANCQTNTPCVIFISCKPPVDPVGLVVKYIQSVQQSGVTRTRYVHRLVPVSGSCAANLPEIQSLCRKVFKEFFDKHPDTPFKFKIELRIRNHTTIPRTVLIQNVAQCVPEGHTVDLQDPEIFLLVEVFKSICGVSVVKDYYGLHKFNVAEIAKRNDQPQEASRLTVSSTPTDTPAAGTTTVETTQADKPETSVTSTENV